MWQIKVAASSSRISNRSSSLSRSLPLPNCFHFHLQICHHLHLQESCVQELKSNSPLAMADNHTKAGEKWTGGIRDMVMECPAWAVWELCADFAGWARWCVPPTEGFEIVCELREGESGKPGCLRYVELAPGVWIHERLLTIDAANLSFSYNIEENTFCGGVKGYVAKVQFREMTDGRTMMESWTFEVEPLEAMTREEFSAFMEGFYINNLVKAVEADAKQVANERKLGEAPTTA